MNNQQNIFNTLSLYLESEIKFYKKMLRKHGVKNVIGHYHQTKRDTYQDILDYLKKLQEENR